MDVWTRLRQTLTITPPQTTEEWIKVIEMRAAIVLRLASSFSLPLLGNEEWLKDSEGPAKEIGTATWDNPPNPKILKTPGVFRADTSYFCGDPVLQEGSSEFWGLTSKGTWVRGHFKWKKNMLRISSYFWTMTLVSIEFRKTTLEEIVNEMSEGEPRKVMVTLSGMISDWHKIAKNRFETIDSVYQNEIGLNLFLH